MSRYRTRHIVAYPFLHTKQDILEYFRLTYSAFVIRETFISVESIIFCSPRCAWFNFNNEFIELKKTACHKLFKTIECLQQYCNIRRCSHCQKYLCMLDNRSLYAQPSDFESETFDISYTELVRFHTVHH